MRFGVLLLFPVMAALTRRRSMARACVNASDLWHCEQIAAFPFLPSPAKYKMLCSPSI